MPWLDTLEADAIRPEFSRLILVYEGIAFAAFAPADRKQFFFFLSRAMHDVLVDQIREDMSLKRGAAIRKVPILDIAIEEKPTRIDAMDLHEALCDPLTH